MLMELASLLVDRAGFTMNEEHRVTINDVAKKAGVSMSTASRALSGINASKETQEKVRKAAEELNYIPNLVARQLSVGRTNAIAIVICGDSETMFYDQYLSTTSSHIAVECMKIGLLPVLIYADAHSRSSIDWFLMGGGVDGLIIVGTIISQELRETLVKTSKPVLFIARPPRGLNFPYVDVDNYQAGYEIGQRFAAQGVHHCVMVTGPADIPYIKERGEGFLEALSRYSVTSESISSGVTFSSNAGEQAISKLLYQNHYFDAVFAHTDLLAAGVIRALTKFGYKIPDDVRVIGFDDIATSKALNPALTTMAQPYAEMAAAAVSMMSDRLDLGKWKVTKQIFAARLVIRGSD